MDIKIAPAPLPDCVAAPAAPASWVAPDRLPFGATLLTGLAGSPCEHRALAAVAASLVAGLAGEGEVFGAPAASQGALYVALGARGGPRAARALAAAVPEEAAAGVLFASVDAKLGPSLARALDGALSDPDFPRLVVVDGAQAGIEGKGRLAQAVAAISRVASVHRAAVAVLVPLTRRNCMDVKSPATGVFEAADAVWEVYDVRDSSAKCVCTHRGGVSGFDVPLARRQAGPRPAADPPALSE